VAVILQGHRLSQQDRLPQKLSLWRNFEVDPSRGRRSSKRVIECQAINYQKRRGRDKFVRQTAHLKIPGVIDLWAESHESLITFWGDKPLGRLMSH